MSIVAVTLSLLLAGQTSAPSGRYGQTNTSPAGTSPPPAAAPTNRAVSPPPGITNTPASAENQAIPPFSSRPAAPSGGLQPMVRSDNDISAPPPTAPAGQSPYRAAPPQPATSPLNQAATPATGIKPSSMIKLMLSPPPGSQLTGSPVSLVDVVSGARSRAEQAHRVEAYWDICSSVADYYLGVREQDEMRKLAGMMPQAGQALQQAETRFAVRLGTSKQAAVASQRRLASMMGRTGSLPLPSDLPHCGSYQAHYDEVFANRPSVEAQELASLLSLRYAELKESAAAITRTQEWVTRVARSESGDGSDTLRALELFALQRRAFVQIARDYNRRIARYAELSTPGDIGAEGLVRMLIKRDNLPTATRPTLPTGTNGRQSNTRSAPPQTFAAEGWESSNQTVSRANTRDESVEPASVEFKQPTGGERSLLVTPQ